MSRNSRGIQLVSKSLGIVASKKIYSDFLNLLNWEFIYFTFKFLYFLGSHFFFFTIWVY